jgi:hypothetical protein
VIEGDAVTCTLAMIVTPAFMNHLASIDHRRLPRP